MVAGAVAQGGFFSAPRSDTAFGAALPLANWMWLAEPPSWDRALVLAEVDSPLNHVMPLRYDEVVAVAPSQCMSTGQFKLPLPSEAVSSVALESEGLGHLLRSPVPRLEAARFAKAVLEECRRVLRPGGVLLVGERNPNWPTHGQDAIHFAPFVVARMLTGKHGRAICDAAAAAGFREVRRYYATPSHELPRSIVPATRAAALLYERFAGSPVTRDTLRYALAWAGLHWVLHPSVMVVAHR